MADPRFFDNRGPFPLAQLCAAIGIPLPPRANDALAVCDVAGLSQAGPQHLSFFEGARAREQLRATKAGFCLIPDGAAPVEAPPSAILMPCRSVGRAFALAARLFYPEHDLEIGLQSEPVDPAAHLGEDVVLGAGAVIGAHAEIGSGTRIGPHAVIGRSVTIGRNCRIGAHAAIACSHIGDEVVIQSGVTLGASGFGFTPGPDGHLKTPQLGRVIVQDRVEIGANSAVARGALGDTVIGEGSKIDNLVQIGHNTIIGRHCIIAGKAGLSGSVILGDYVLVGGMVGISDHVTVGDGARFAALSGVARDAEAGRDYGGIPARPVRDWHRETAALAKLARTKHKKDE
jgi:UDP-3-O-[3-hydroxymyristoyl] glucosamine N-acyltransferase